MIAQLLEASEAGDEIVAHVLGVGCGEPDALDAADVIDASEQFGEADPAGIGVDVLPQEEYLPDAGVRMPSRLFHNPEMVSADFPAPHVWNDAIGAVVVASLHDIDIRPVSWNHECLMRHNLQRWDAFAEPCVNDRPVFLAFLLDGCADAVQLMGPQHDIDMRHAGNDVRALLLGDASGDGDDQGRLSFFIRPEPADIAQGLLVGLLAHRAGVQNNQIRLFQRLSWLPSFPAEYGIHLLAVEIIHLAAVGEDLHVSFHG